jgi:hypothetical protein
MDKLIQLNEWASHPDRILAVVGGAAVAGFGLPWLVQMAVRGWTGQKVPRWIMMTMRVVTGGLSAWLVALWLAAGGGGGFGGPGGFGFGTGTNSEDRKPADTTKTEEKIDKREEAQNVNTLKVEVLGTETLKKKFGNNKADMDRIYRIHTPDGPQYLTLKQVEDYIKQRAADDPPLKNLILVSYTDGPSRNAGPVSQLEDWAGTPVNPGSSTRLSVGYKREYENAPVE